MKMVDYYIDSIKDELCGALDYSEKYVEYKTSRPQWARLYHDMGLQEITHAENFKSMGQTAIEEIKSTFISEEDMENWTKCMSKFAEKIAMAKMMLNS